MSDWMPEQTRSNRSDYSEALLNCSIIYLHFVPLKMPPLRLLDARIETYIDSGQTSHCQRLIQRLLETH